jgi:O-antigen/teichoic acid export membrane protein
MKLSVNISANFIGQIFTSLIGFIFIPIYIHYLGVESYGLIGIFSIITAWLSILDAGLSPALIREMALFTGGKYTPFSIRTLLFSVEYFFLIVGIVIFFLLLFGSSWISIYWIHSKSISSEIIKKSILLMGVMFSLKFFESIYKNSIIGLQYQVQVNIYEIVISLIKAIGSIILLKYISPSLLVFFTWQLFLSFVYLLFLKYKINSLLPASDEKITFSLSSLISLKSFAGGMMIMVILSLFQTQVDKILLSKILSLKEFGLYTLTFTAAGALMVLTSPVSQALYPRMNQLFQKGDQKEFMFLYHIGNQMIVILFGSASVLLFFFPKLFLFFWTNNPDITNNSSSLLAVVTLGFFFSGINTISFTAILAYSKLKAANYIKIFLVVISIPAIIYFVPKYGSMAAAIIWLLGTFFNYICTLVIIFKIHDVSEMLYWFIHDLLLPVLPIFFILIMGKLFIPDTSSRFVAGGILLFLFINCVLFSAFFSIDVRQKGILYLKNLFF